MGKLRPIFEPVHTQIAQASKGTLYLTADKYAPGLKSKIIKNVSTVTAYNSFEQYTCS